MTIEDNILSYQKPFDYTVDFLLKDSDFYNDFNVLSKLYQIKKIGDKAKIPDGSAAPIQPSTTGESSILDTIKQTLKTGINKLYYW